MCALSLLALLIVGERAYTYHEPLERDITTYAIIGSEMLKGRQLYTDLWDHKPPGVHLIFAGLEAVFGETRVAIFLLGLLTAFGTLLGIYYAILRLSGDRKGALIGALFWALVASDMPLAANQPNCEVILNVLLVWAFALMITAKPVKADIKRWIAVGLLFSAASLCKQVVAPIPFFLGLAYIGFRPKDWKERKMAVGQVGIAAVTVILSWALVAAYFGLTHRFKDFYDAVFVYNRFYSGNIKQNLLTLFTLNSLLPTFFIGLIPLILLTLASIVLGIRKERSTGVLLLSYLIGAQVAIGLPGQYFPHYYQLILPPMLIGAGWAISLASDLPLFRSWRIPLLVGALIAAFVVAREAPMYRMSPVEWSISKYGNQFILTEQLEDKLKQILKPGETFYEWGAETDLYFSRKESPLSGVFYVYPLVEGPLRDGLSKRVVSDLDKNPPDLFICSRLDPKYYVSQGNTSPVLNWVFQKYSLLASTRRDPFWLYVRNGSGLDARIRAMAASAGNASQN